MNKKVFVSGCFDLLHSGHIRFLEEAATYGDVYVGLGSDRTVAELKGRAPINTQDERKYMLEALRHVKKCFVEAGFGKLDFVEELKAVAPDIFVEKLAKTLLVYENPPGTEMFSGSQDAIGMVFPGLNRLVPAPSPPCQ